jgi:hypothetical protein
MAGTNTSWPSNDLGLSGVAGRTPGRVPRWTPTYPPPCPRASGHGRSNPGLGGTTDLTVGNLEAKSGTGVAARGLTILDGQCTHSHEMRLGTLDCACEEASSAESWPMESTQIGGSAGMSLKHT